MLPNLISTLESTLETIEAQGLAECQKLRAELIITIAKLRQHAEREQLGIDSGDPFPPLEKSLARRRFWCWWDSSWNALMVQSPTGFFLSFSIPDGFWTAIRQEAETPGFLRDLIPKRTQVSPNPHRLDDRTVAQAKADWEKTHGIKRYTPTGKMDLSLEDLDL